jgi:lipid-binding SYLF domain-containing protein
VDGVRGALLAAGDGLTGLLRSRAVADAWSSPSALEGMTVGGVAGQPRGSVGVRGDDRRVRVLREQASMTLEAYIPTRLVEIVVRALTRRERDAVGALRVL